MIINALPNFGPVLTNRLCKLVDGDVEALFRTSAKVLSRAKGVSERMIENLHHWSSHFDLVREKEQLARIEARYVIVDDPLYPELLKELPDPPLGLYWRGAEPATSHTVAIVGTRRMTLYGEKMARSIARDLAARGVTVVSGLARGIDARAHEGAIQGQGMTIGVLGCGVDRIYPPENADLARQMMEKGAVVSEFPLGRRADRQTFPIRNRVVAGMCAGLLVVESDRQGGSMITARFAEEQNRTVFALPGRVDQASSQGCLQLIRDGAVLVRSAEDIIEEMNFGRAMQPQLPGWNDPLGSSGSPEADQRYADLSPEAQAILDILANGERRTVDELSELSQLPSGKMSAQLMRLEIKGLLRKCVDGRFESVRS